MSGNEGLTAAMLAEHFRGIGIRSGDNLVLHSSFKSLGPVAGGPSAVVEALVEVLGPAGNLMVPTFTYCIPVWNTQPFDVKHSKGRVGVVPEAVRSWPGALRSFHPTHSVAVIGPDAEEIVRNHMHATPIGLESPFGRMHAKSARILGLGTRQDTNSSLHYVEVVARLPYIHVPFSAGQDHEIAWFFNENGQVEYTQIREVPGCSRGFPAIEQKLRDCGVLQDVEVGQARSYLMDMDSFVKASCEILAADPTLILCSMASCTICPKRRKAMESFLSAS